MTRVPSVPARAARAVVTAALLAVLAACSGSSSTGATQASGSAAPSGAGSGSASGSASASAAAAAGGSDAAALAARVIGAVRGRTAHVSMTSLSSGSTTTGSGDVRFGDVTEMSMRVVAGTTTMNLVLVDRAMYVKTAALPTKKWVKIAAGASDRMSQALAPTLRSISSNASVESMLKSYDGVPVTTGGTSTLDDVRVTEYRYDLDEAALTAGIPDELKEQAGTAFVGGTGTTSMWVDDEGLVRKVVAVVSLKTGTTTTTLRYTGWGEKITIEAPKESDTIAAGDLKAS